MLQVVGLSCLCNPCSRLVNLKCSGLQDAAEYRRIKDWVFRSCNSPHTLPTKHLNHVYHSYTHSLQPHLTQTPHQHCRHPHTLTAHTHATQTTVHASQSPQQPHAQHRVLRQPHKQTKDYHRTANTTQVIFHCHCHKHTGPAVKVREISSYCKST